MGKKGNVAIGAALAAGLGYAVGLLTAPKSGRETRKELKKAAQKAKTEAEKNLKKAQTELTELLDEINDKAKKSTGKAKDELEKLTEQAKVVRQKTRELLSAVHEGEAEDNDLQQAIIDVKKANDHLRKYLAKKPETEKAS